MLTFILEIIRQEKKFLGIFLFYTLCVSVLLYFYPLQETLLKVQTFGEYAALLFVLLYVVRGFFYFPTLYFLVASGILFTPYLGFTLYLSSILLSATLSYVIGKYLHNSNKFPRFKQRIQEPEIKGKISKQGLKGVFFFHITGISLDIPNYLSGYVGLPYGKFMASVFSANVLTASAYYVLFVCLFK